MRGRLVTFIRQRGLAVIATRPGWLRHSDYRPNSFGVHETRLED